MSEAFHILAVLDIAISEIVKVPGITPPRHGVDVRIVFAAGVQRRDLEEIQFSAIRSAHSMPVPQQPVMQMISLEQFLELFKEVF